MKIFLYPTDWLFLGGVLAICAWTLRLRHDRALRARWIQVLQVPFAGGAAVVIAAYFLVAILDSIHLEHANARDSLLDLLSTPLKYHVETSYSTPLGLYGFVKESLTDVQGATVRDYPRLQYGGAHLVDAGARSSDVLQRAGCGALWGAITWFAVVSLMRYCVPPWRRRSLKSLARLETTIVFGALLVVSGVLCALAPYYHLFGTDKVGNDVLYQALKSIRTGLVLCTLTTLMSLPLAIILGIAAGYCRGWLDDVIQYLYTTIASIPGVLLIAAAALTLDVQLSTHVTFASAELRADWKLFALCGVLGLTGWTSLCRLLRAEALKLRAVEFVTAAQALGARGFVIAWRHLLPNTMHLIIISTVLDFSGLVLAEAVLTYINIGVDPNTQSWGNMINGARLDLAREPAVWWSLAAAGIFMFGFVLAVNLFADAVRDVFDPRQRASAQLLALNVSHDARD